MKTTAKILVFVAVLFVLGFLVQAQEIPGGIVYSDGKDAIYREFKTGQTINLTADLKGSSIKGPLAASEDGLLLIWLQDGKFAMRRLPDGKSYPATMKKIVDERGNEIKEGHGTAIYVPLPPIQKEIRNLTLSPEGLRFGFEYTEKEKAWILVEPGKPGKLHRVYNTRTGRTTLEPDETIYPKYRTQIDEFNAIAVLHSVAGSTRLVQGYNRYGNAAFYPPTFPIRLTYDMLSPDEIARRKRDRVVSEPGLSSITTPDLGSGLTVTVKEAHKKFSIKRDAHFLTWQKASSWQSGQQFLALIYKTDKGWGPIEIRDNKPIFYGNPITRNGRLYSFPIENQKPGVWEIPVSLASCDGLSWKPDGSLTYLSDGKVFLLDGYQIKQGIENSGIAKNPDPHRYTPVPVNNVFAIGSELVVSGINGDRHHWISNDTFLFRGKEEGSLSRTLYVWCNGKVERLLSLATEEFSYCDRAPSGIAGPVFGKDRAFSGLGPGGGISKFYIGSIETHWHGQTGNRVMIYVAGGHIEELEYALPFETNIEDIRNPLEYDYRKIPKKSGELPCVTINLDRQILLLKSGNRYAAIKPLELEHKYKSIEEMVPEVRRDWLEYKDKGPPPIWDWMTYEWKYWPASSVIAFSKDDKAAKPMINPFLSTSGKAEALERPFTWRQDIPNPPSEFYMTGPPEFCVTAGNIKTFWGRGNNIEPALRAGYLSKENNLGWSIVPHSRIEDIANPSKYKYIQPDYSYSYGVVVGFNEILILRRGNEYAAIRPIAIFQKYKSIEEMPEHLRNHLLTNLDPRSPRPSGRCLTYEWKYWSIPSTDSAKANSLTQK